MKLKKIITLLIAYSMLALICGCGANDFPAQLPSETEESAPVTEEKTSPICADINEQTYFPKLQDEVANSSIFVQKIDGLDSDFIKGMDISSLIAEEESGVKYYDYEGNEADLFKILSDSGINCVRVRVWNDPYDKDGNGYGGGNCDVEKAAKLGSRAAEYGIKLVVDFHYSDFWADPNKQFAPKAWEDMDLVEKADAISTFTYESLIEIINSGADLYMVQIGNETNAGMAGVTDFDDVTELLRAATDAVRDVNYEWNEYELSKGGSETINHEIKVAVHYTNIDNHDGTIEVAKRFSEAGLSFDVFGVSYYPYWHGTMDNMTDVLSTIKKTYGYDTCVMETAYMFTGDDTDGAPNSVSLADELPEYPVSIQGQANCVRDVMNAAWEAGAIGVFYWEGAWIAVGSDAQSNSSLWEKYGSGWASSYASDYDPEDAGVYYGGSSWDNQAFFDMEGHVLESLNVFKYVNYGAISEDVEVIKVNDIDLVFSPGEELVLPEKIDVVYNDPSLKEGITITWLEEDVASINMKGCGEYVIRGAIEGDIYVAENAYSYGDGYVRAYISVKNINFLVNHSFEDEEAENSWTVTSMTDEDPTDIQEKSADAYSGSHAFHYWSEKPMEFEVAQIYVSEKTGSYALNCYMQGGDFGDDDEIYLFARVTHDGSEKEYKSDNVKLDGWVNWKNPWIENIEVSEGDEIIIGVYTKAQAKAWATYDDFELCIQ